MQNPRFVWVHYDEDCYTAPGAPPDAYWTNLCLGIAKHGGKWRVCFGCYDCQQDPSEMTFRPVTDCAMDIRVGATKGVNKLKAEIVKASKEYLPEIDKGIEILENFLADV